MKKLALLFAALLGLAGQASAQQYGEELTLGSIRGWGWSATTIVTSDEEIPQLPASVKIPGNWGDVKLYTGSFDANDYTGFKVVLGEAPAEGSVQFYYRNAAQASAYGGTYLPWEGDNGGTLSEDGLTFTGTFSLEKLDDDAIITQLALQNRTSSSVTVIINGVYLIDKDGNEVATTGLNATGWNAATITPLTVPEDGESKDVYEFTNQYGEVGVDFGETQEIAADQPHIFTLVSSEPIPDGEFQWKIYNEDGSNTYAAWELESENVVTYTMPANYTGISIQHFVSSTSYLPQDIKLYRKIVDGPIARETLPVKVGGSAVMEDPNPGEEMGENGLPVGVNLPGSWGGYGLWNEPFSAAEYPAFKVVLRERPENVQFFYRTHVPDADGGNVEQTVYVPWETNEENDVEVSEDGTTLTGWFDIDKLGSSDIEAIALQNTGGSAVKVVVMQVYLMNEDEEWIETPGLGSSISIWNTGSTYPVTGSYDEDGNLYDAYVTFTAANDYVGAYGAAVEEGTYHVVTFYTEEALPEGLVPVVAKYTDFSWTTFQWTTEPVAYEVIKKADNALSVKILTDYSPYDFWGNQFGGLQLMYRGDAELLPLKTRFTKIVREVYEATQADYAYGLVGDFTSWTTDVFLTKDAENPGIYTLTLADQQIKDVKDYEYKIRANMNYDLYQLPYEGNFSWTPERTGVYNLTFTFNLNEHTLDLVAERTGDCTWTVTFVNGCAWEKVYAYTFEPELNGTWPGEELTTFRHSTYRDVDIYTYTYSGEAAPKNIIFNAGVDMPQTRDLEFVDGKEYGWYNYSVSYVNVENWDAVYAYTFEPEVIGGWPGKAMTKTEEQVDEHDVYTVSFVNDEAPAFIIFNNGNGGDDNQTADLAFENGKQYNDGSKTSTGISDVKVDLKNAVIYNMAGQRVQNVQKGLYIVNGKKVVLK